MRVVHIQPALPAYRFDFFRRLSERYGENFHVYYSPVDMGPLTKQRAHAAWEHPIGPMLQPMRGIEWQVGALSVPIKKGDIVVVCGAPRNLAILLLLIKARIVGARTIWWGQYWSATSIAQRHRLRMTISRLADALLFYTDAEVARFYKDGWTHRGPVAALNNGLDLTEVCKLRRPYRSDERGHNLLFIGRLTAKAELNFLIAALASANLSKVHLHVVGSGPEEKTLREQAELLDVVEQITWYGGTTDEVLIADIANRCAAFVYPGSVGLSLIHAMGYGLPSIVHNQKLCHMPEICAFEEGVTGSSFRKDDVNSLAITTSKLLDASEIRDHMSLRCRVVTEGSFTTEDMARRFIAFVDHASVHNKEKSI